MYNEIEREKKESKFVCCCCDLILGKGLELVEASRKKIRDLEVAIESIKIEAQRVIREKDQQIEFCGKELKKNANVQYIKNILLNFLTSPDHGVREKIIPVLSTVLQFTPTELESVKSAWEKEHKSLLGNNHVSSVI